MEPTASGGLRHNGIGLKLLPCRTNMNAVRCAQPPGLVRATSREETMGSLRLRLRPLVIAFAALATLAFVASEADARAGGGRSFGSRGTNTFSAPPPTRTAPNAASPMERSMTQPGQPGALSRQATPARQPGGLFNRPGLLGGLAAGLLGLLFGHGLLGGLGGLASLFGLLLQIGLVVIVASLLWRWWQRRQQPAMAGAPHLRSIDSGPQPGFGGLGGFG